MAEPGRLIGPYRLLSILGRGAMGEVWRARDERLDRLVALKLLPRQQASAERRARMVREAKAAAAIGHRNVVTLYDIVSEDGEDVLIMELVEGRTLSAVVAEEGPLEIDRALSIIAELADALAFAHQRGVLHRDIKSANVMLADDGAVRVLDFGLAKLLGGDEAPAPGSTAIAKPTETDRSGPVALDATMEPKPQVSATMLAVSPSQSGSDPLMTQAGQLLGTPLYMAPEQLAGEPPSEASEIFSVGVVAYELLAGAPPFSGSDFDDLYDRVLTEPPPPLPESADREVAVIVETALAKDPAARFADMATLRDRVRAVIDRRQARPRRWWPLVAAVLATFLLAGAAGIWWARDARAPGPDAAPARPGDQYVEQALREYNLFYNQEAARSLRAAARVDPDHPRIYAYAILFAAASGPELDRAITEARRIRRELELNDVDRALIDAAIAEATEGPAAARQALLDAGVIDGELAFWSAELAYRARDYAAAESAFREVLERSDPAFRGRVYDHFSAVLSYFGKTAEALEIGRRYAEAFAGEADAIGVYATTLAYAGRLDDALAQAKEARRLYEGEDTVAGLAKVHALRGELDQARALYRKSAAMAPDSRRPLRRAALAYLAWAAGDDDEARREVAACLPGGDDDGIWERGPCLWVAGVVWPDRIDVAIAELDKLAAAGSPLRPPYGFPKNLANLLRAKKIHFAGGCRREQPEAQISAADAAKARELIDSGRDFFAQYHIPFFAEYARCELEAL